MIVALGTSYLFVFHASWSEVGSSRLNTCPLVAQGCCRTVWHGHLARVAA
jgi:hypothetical protein